MICYLRTSTKTGQPYLSMVDGRLIEHPQLIIEGHSRMKIMLIDPLQDMPVDAITEILDSAIKLQPGVSVKSRVLSRKLNVSNGGKQKESN